MSSASQIERIPAIAAVHDHHSTEPPRPERRHTDRNRLLRPCWPARTEVAIGRIMLRFVVLAHQTKRRVGRYHGLNERFLQPFPPPSTQARSNSDSPAVRQPVQVDKFVGKGFGPGEKIHSVSVSWSFTPGLGREPTDQRRPDAAPIPALRPPPDRPRESVSLPATRGRRFRGAALARNGVRQRREVAHVPSGASAFLLHWGDRRRWIPACAGIHPFIQSRMRSLADQAVAASDANSMRRRRATRDNTTTRLRTLNAAPARNAEA